MKRSVANRDETLTPEFQVAELKAIHWVSFIHNAPENGNNHCHSQISISISISIVIVIV